MRGDGSAGRGAATCTARAALVVHELSRKPRLGEKRRRLYSTWPYASFRLQQRRRIRYAMAMVALRDMPIWPVRGGQRHTAAGSAAARTVNQHAVLAAAVDEL